METWNKTSNLVSWDRIFLMHGRKVDVYKRTSRNNPYSWILMEVKLECNLEGMAFQQAFLERLYSHMEHMNLNVYLISNPKINSRMVVHLNVKRKVLKLSNVLLEWEYIYMSVRNRQIFKNRTEIFLARKGKSG